MNFNYLIEKIKFNSFRQYFKGDTFIYFLSRVLGILSQVISIKLISKNFILEDTSIWFINNSFLPLIALVDIGIGNLLVSKSTIIINTKGERELKKFVRMAIQFVLILTLILILIIFCTLYPFYSFFIQLLGNYSDYLPVFLSFFIFSILNVPPISSLQACIGTNKIDKILISSTCTQAVFIIVLLNSIKYGLLAATFYSYGFLCIANWISFFFIWGNLFDSINFSKIRRWINLFKETFPYLLIQSSIILQINLDTFFVAKFSSLKDVPIFVITQKIYTLPILLLATYLNICWPKVTKLNLDKNRELHKFFKLFQIRSLSIALFLSLVVFLISPFIITFLGDTNYQTNYQLLTIFSIYLLVNALIGSQSALLNGLRKIQIQIYIVFFSVFSNAFLSIYFSKNFGVIGPILATLIVNAVVIFIYGFYINNKKLLITS